MSLWRRRKIREKPMAVGGVWIVLQDESPHNTVLGVFATQVEAFDFAEEIRDQFVNGVIYTRFPVGYRYNGGPGHVSYGPSE